MKGTNATKTSESSVRAPKRRKSRLRRMTAADYIICVFLLLVVAVMIYPFLFVFGGSFSDGQDYMSGGVWLLPRVWTLANYQVTVSDSLLWIAYRNTVLRTCIGSLLSLSFTSLVSYAMSRRELKGRRFFQVANLITMFFGGGLIPYFALINFIGLYDSFLVYIVPALYSVYNMIVLSSGYRGISEELHDSAVIDGAGEIRIWAQIYFPLSKAVHATVLLWLVVGNWNSYYSTMIYTRGGGQLELNFVTEETAQFKVSDTDVSLTDKAGIKVKVNNSDGAQLDWELVLTDGEARYTASSKGAGLVEQDGVIVYGNVFSLRAGFAGTLYIPFNMYRGNTYGAIQTLSFDYEEGEKPASVKGTIYLNLLSGQDKSVAAKIFEGWEYVTELPKPTKAEIADANLYVAGNRDFIGGVSVEPMTESVASNAGQTRPIKITPQSSLSFEAAGIAFRVKNLSDQEFGWRLYAYASDGKVYVPQAKNDYVRISSDGTIQEVTDTNRNMIIPAGFDGTIVAHFADYATDNAASDVGQNVVREGLSVDYFNIYSSGYSEGVLMGNAALIAYDGTVSTLALGMASIGDPNAGTQYEAKGFRLREITAASVTADSAEVKLSADYAIFGRNEIVLTPVEGKLITGIRVPEGCNAVKNADGSYTVILVRPVTAQENAYQIGVTVENALSVSVKTEGSGTVFHEGISVQDRVVVPESAAWYLTATAAAGFETIVTADGTVVPAEEMGYQIPAGTKEVVVTFARLQANVSVTVDGEGEAFLDGKPLEESFAAEQGKTYLLTVVPVRGYEASVRLNGTALQKGEEGYEVIVYGDGELCVSFVLAIYTITYDLDRGENGDNPKTYTVQDEVVFEPAVKEGYTFLYWYLLSETDEETRIEGIERGSVGDLTVYAKFSMNDAGEPGAEKSLPVWVWWTVGGATALAIGIAAVVAVVKKRNRKA